MTPGMKTSEFLMALIPMVLGFALIVFGTLKGQQSLVELGVIMITGGSAGYGISRGLSKIGASSPPALPPPADDKGAASTIAGIK